MFEFLEDLGDMFLGNKRQGALKHFAKAKGFQYQRRVNPSLIPMNAQRMEWYEGNKSRSLKGLLFKEVTDPNYTATIFDYQHQHEFGTKVTTVFLYKNDELGLPTFKISPRGTLGKLSSLFSSSEWSYVNKEFDRSYSVESSDMNAMRMMITIQFADISLDLEGFTIEGDDEYLAIYKHHYMVDIIDMDNHHQSAIDLIDIILYDNSNELI